jgi:hypothetical protein
MFERVEFRLHLRKPFELRPLFFANVRKFLNVLLHCEGKTIHGVKERIHLVKGGRGGSSNGGCCLPGTGRHDPFYALRRRNAIISL